MIMKKIGLLNGPNLDRLGKREPEVYGSVTLEEIVKKVESKAETCDCKVAAFQSNHEGALIDKIHEWADSGFSGLILNPGGLTHTSVALRDAISERPKIGFLKFGISFLKVRNLRVSLDLRQTTYQSLLAKWDQLASKRSIRYATIQPFSLSITDQFGEMIDLNATQAKFTASGELRLWGDVVLMQNGLQKDSSKISILHEQKTNSLNLYFDKNKEESMRIYFPTNEFSSPKKSNP